MESLTRTEVEVLKDLAQGFTQKEIAQRRFRSVDTIKSHVSHVMRKFHARNAVNLIALAKDFGLIMLLLCLFAQFLSPHGLEMRCVPLVRSFRVDAGCVEWDEV